MQEGKSTCGTKNNFHLGGNHICMYIRVRKAAMLFTIGVACIWVTWHLVSGQGEPPTPRKDTQGSSPSCGRHPTRQPNIIFILADDLGWNDVGFHGSVVKTPVLDSLAKGGIILDSYYVQPICTPSRAQLLSGRYQIHTGLQHGILWPPQPNGLPLDQPTLADLMTRAGYHSHMVGKWHLGFYKDAYLPYNRGFQSFYGILTGQSGHFNHSHCWTYTDGDEKCGLDLHSNNNVVSSKNGSYSSRLYGSRAGWLIKRHARRSPDKPLFMYLAFQNPHTPNEVPDLYSNLYPSVQDKDRKIHSAMVSALDHSVGHVVKALKTASLWDNTILVFSSDNGGQVLTGGNNYPLRGWKGSYWEGGMRGVSFVHSPMLPKGGQTRQQLLHVSDWLPTLVHLAGGNVDNLQLDGFDVWDAICADTPSPRNEILHNIDPLSDPLGDAIEGAPFDVRIQSAIRSGPWKLLTGNPGSEGLVIVPADVTPYEPGWWARHQANHNLYTEYSGTKNVWLFNIAQDPHEEVDLAEKHPEVVSTLLQRLAAYNASAVPAVFPEFDLAADPTLHGGVWGPWR